MSAVLATFIIGLAFFIESAIGFGGGLVAIPLLGLLMPLSVAVPLVSVFQFCVGLLILRIYKDIDWRLVVRFMPGVLLGTIAGFYSLKHFNEDYVRIFLALFVLSYLLYRHKTRATIKLPDSLSIAGLFSIAGGWIMGLIGTGGPLYVIYFQSFARSPRSFRASLIFAFFLTHILRLPGYYFSGLFSAGVWQVVIWTFPVFLLCLWAGHHYHYKIPEKAFHKLVTLLLSGAALSLLLKAVF